MIIYLFLLLYVLRSTPIMSQQNYTMNSSRRLPPLSVLQYETPRKIATSNLNNLGFRNCLTCGQEKYNCSSDEHQQRSQHRCLWTNAEISYEVSEETLPDLHIIKKAMKHFERHTCLRFREVHKTEQVSNVLYFVKEDGCWSSIGMTGGRQELSLGEECNKVEVAIHEIGHAIGLYHEHSRKDRDKYIVVYEENLIPHMKFVLDKENDSNYGIPYDYTSIMHYQLDGYSIDPISKRTIMTINPLDAYLVRERKRLSFRDIQLVNTMYKCNAHCIFHLPCLNTGYVGLNCLCVCPPGTAGILCENKYRSYYPSNDCGGMVKQEGPLKSPKHPGPLDEEMKCIWWIKAPVNNTVQIIFRDFDLEDRYIGQTAYFNKKCAWDRLEVRTNDIYQGTTFCGKEIEVGDSFTSEKQDLVLEYTSMTPYKQGFSIKIIFVPNDS